MTVFWQNLLVLGIVLVAAVYVGRRVWRWVRLKRPTGCWSCRGCPRPGREDELISIDPPGEPRGR